MWMATSTHTTKSKEVHFYTMENLIEEAATPGVKSRVLDDEVLLLISAKEPPTSADVARNQQ
jgi:hypothetical protein